MSQVNYDYGAMFKNGLEVFKANLVPSLAAAAAVFFIPFIGWICMINYLAMVKKYREDQQPMDVAALFNFDHAVDKMLVVLIYAVAASFMVVPGALVFFAMPMIADKPGTNFGDALQQAFNFHKSHFVPSLILLIVIAIVQSIGMVACCVGIFATFPIGQAMLMEGYMQSKDAMDAAQAA